MTMCCTNIVIIGATHINTNIVTVIVTSIITIEVDTIVSINNFIDIFIVIIPQTKGGTTGVGFLLILYRITFAHQDFPSPPTCLDLPRLA